MENNIRCYQIETITLKDVVEMLSNGDDEHHNQVRVTEDGNVYLSQDIVGNENLHGLAFRYETFAAGNGYVAKEIRTKPSGRKFAAELFESLKEFWIEYKSSGEPLGIVWH